MICFKVRSEVNHTSHDKIVRILGKSGSQAIQNSIYSFENDTYSIPQSVSCITVTMSGGGGCGGSGTIKNGIFYSGGGGGAGGACLKKPICISNPLNEIVSVKTIIGKGGTPLSPDGENTIVNVCVGSKIIFKHIAHGGKRGGYTDSNNKGGKGGSCSTNEMFGGYDGLQGSVSLSGVGKVFGGRGGNSAFEEGGLGGNQINPFNLQNEDGYECKNNDSNPQGMNGSMGSGGGGSVPGIDPLLIGLGGDGFVIIEM